MAVILIRDSQRRLEDELAIAEFLAPFGIYHERWPVEERVDADAPAADILRAFAPEIDRLKTRGGYVTADVISVSPETPNLDALMARYSMEHWHAEDEVRFILKGRGLFHIHPKNGPIFAIQVEEGDLINVPRGILHWFDLCSDRTIRAIRLFLDPAGWTPNYTGSELHRQHEPVCWGPAHIGSEAAFQSVVQP